MHRPSTPEPAISLEFLVWAPVLLFSIVAHEYAHAEAAYRQGDDTAYMLGRITFNPLKHIDMLPPQAGLQFRRLQALGFLPILLVVWVFPGALRTLLWPAQQLMSAGLALVGGFAIGPGARPS